MAIDFNKLTKGTGSKYDTQIERVRFESFELTPLVTSPYKGRGIYRHSDASDDPDQN